MPTVTHSVIDPVGAQPVGVRSVEVRVVAPNPLDRVYRATDGFELAPVETITLTPDGTGTYPSTFSLALAANADLLPAGSRYEVRMVLVGDNPQNPRGAVSIVVPAGAGSFRLIDCLNVAPDAVGALVPGVTPAGDYDAARTYYLRQIVTHQGSAYVARATTTGVTPGTNPDAWQLLVAGGGSGGGGGGTVSSVNTKSGDVFLSAGDVGAQPADADLATLAGLDTATPGVVATDGTGWLRKTWAQARAALGLAAVATSGSASDLSAGTLAADRITTEVARVIDIVPTVAADSRFVRQLAPPSGDATGATDTATIQAALTGAASSGASYVRLAAGGAYIASGLAIDSLVTLDLNGASITAPNGANDSVLTTKDYSTLVAGDTTGGPRDFTVVNGYLDGNRNNQSATDKPVLAIYGRRYTLDAVVIRGGKGAGLHTKWSTSSPFLAPNGFESFVTRLYVHSCDGDGIRFEGPHDAYFHNIFIVKCGNASTSVPLNLPDSSGRANGSNFDKFHIYGGNGYGYGLVVNTSGTKFTNFVIEGAQTAQALIQASQVQFDAAHLYSGGINTGTVKGVQVGDSTHTAINGLAIRAKVENCGGGAFDFTNMGDHNWVEGHVYYYTASPAPTLPALGWVGTPSSPNRIQLYVADNTFTPTAQSLNQQVGPIKARRANATDSRDLVSLLDASGGTLWVVDASGRPRSKSGSTPTVGTGSSAGTGATAALTQGTDHAGTISVTTGTNPAPGQLIAVTFAFSWSAVPRAVVVTPKDAGGSALQPFVTTASTAFSLRCAATPAPSTSYSFDYIVIGS